MSQQLLVLYELRKPTQLVGDDGFVLTGMRHLSMHPMLTELCLDVCVV